MKNHVTFLILALTSLLIVSCGGDENKVNTNTNPVTGGGIYPQGTGYNSQEEQQLIEQLKQQLQCPTGPVSYSSGNSQLHGSGQRIQDVVFSKAIQNSDHTKICGQFQNGPVSGTPGQMYVGVSAYNDIMVVTEIVNGTQVLGHNVRLSMCGQYAMSYTYNNSYSPQQTRLPLIDSQRTLTNFRTSNNSCIVIDKDNFCPHGVVDFASQTVMTAGPYNANGMNLQAVEIYTSFAKPTCNGNY